MSLAIGVGFLTTYPVNRWLVSTGRKHGLMTVRANQPQQGRAERASDDAPQPAPGSPLPSGVARTTHLTMREV